MLGSTSQGKGIRGFSLLEVILAMVVIGLLAALLVPAVRTARERADRRADVANLRQIGVALLGFAGDNQNNFPMAAGRIGWGEASPVTGAGPWTEQVLPYLGGGTRMSFVHGRPLPLTLRELSLRAIFWGRGPRWLPSGASVP